MVKVSVVIPAYNVELYIEKCVHTVLNQTLQEIEVIVINDGSTDKTFEILNTIKDKRLILINQKNQGVSQARDAGIKVATGKYLFQLDGDDWIENSALFDMFQMAELENADVVIIDAYYDDEKKLILLPGAAELTGDNVQDLLLCKISPNVWSKLYKRSLFVDHNITYNSNITIGEDFLVNLELCFYAKNISRINKAYVHYMQREVSLTKVYSEKLLQVYDMIDLVKSYLLKNNILDRYEKEVEFLDYQHTYFYRVMIDTKSRRIHRKFYDIGMIKYQKFLINPYVRKFLEEKSKGEQQIEKLFRYNYNLGRFRLRLTTFFHLLD